MAMNRYIINGENINKLKGLPMHYYFYVNIIAFMFTGCGKTTFLDLLTGRRHKGTMQVTMIASHAITFACNNVIVARTVAACMATLGNPLPDLHYVKRSKTEWNRAWGEAS